MDLRDEIDDLISARFDRLERIATDLYDRIAAVKVNITAIQDNQRIDRRNFENRIAALEAKAEEISLCCTESRKRLDALEAEIAELTCIGHLWKDGRCTRCGCPERRARGESLMIEHPTPWRVHTPTKNVAPWIVDADGYCVATGDPSNLERIVAAVNAHDGLVAAANNSCNILRLAVEVIRAQDETAAIPLDVQIAKLKKALAAMETNNG